MIGIYKIENLINHKCYIGQSKNIQARWKKHICTSQNRKSKSYNYPLYCSFRKYGIENFSFEVVEECTVDELNDKEIGYISIYNSFLNGYNQTIGGNNSTYRPTEEILGIIEDLKRLELTYIEIAEKWGLSRTSVISINFGKTWMIKEEEYPIRKQVFIKKNGNIVFLKQEKTKKYCIDCGKEITGQTAVRCVDCSNIARRKVNRPTAEELELKLKELKSFTAVGKYYGVSDKMISKWCKAYDMSTNISAYKPPAKEKREKTLPKSVHMIDSETNKVLRTFCSILEAERFLGLDKPGQVSKACRGIRKTAYGYKWAFAE